MQYQACFDRFTQTDFVGEHDPGRRAIGRFMGDKQLMRNQRSPPALQAFDRRLLMLL